MSAESKNKLFNKLNIKDGKVIFMEGDCYHKEDLLQIEYTNNLIVDVGYYESQFIIMLIENKDWQNPIKTVSADKKEQMIESLQEMINSIVQKGNNMQNNICPICQKNIVSPPNEVCIECYNHLKHDEVDPENKFDIELWQDVTKDGLPASYVATAIVDAAEHLPTENEWHKRRIYLIKDCVDMLDISLFIPATRKQLDDFVSSAIDYWNGEIDEQERLSKYLAMKKLLKKEDVGSWDARGLPLWMMQPKESFDWMWEQFIDCVHDCVDGYMNDEAWVSLLQKHFSDTIKEWVNKPYCEVKE